MAWFSGPGSSSPPRRSASYSHSPHSARDQHAHTHARSPPRHAEKQNQYYFTRPAASSASTHSYSSSRGYSSRARPRSGYINRMIAQMKRYLRELYYYARKNPVKMFMLVIMPLITGGALADVLRRFGIRLPAGIASMLPGGRRGGYGGGYGSSSGGSSLGGVGGVQGLMKLAQMFI